MKILLDENMPSKVNYDFGSGHEVYTVREMNWLGKKNGELLTLADMHGFDFFVTLDKNLRFQQNLEKYAIRFLLVFARNNKPRTIEPFIGISNLCNEEASLAKITEVRG